MSLQRLLTRLFAALLIGTLMAGCVTETKSTGASINPGAEDLQEASRINTQLGFDYMRKGMNDLALEKLNRALEQNPRNADAHSALALLYTRTGDAPAAERHYRRALALEPNNPAIQNSFGAWLCSSGKAEESIQYFLQAAQNPRYRTPAAAYSNAGACAAQLNRLDEAEKYLRQALQLDEKFADALAQMAIVSYRQRSYLQARAFVQRYESVGNVSPDMLVLGMRTETQLGDSRAAKEYERRLRSNYPEVAERLDSQPANPNQ